MAVELVVGLGNPGVEYAATRHNVGFRVVDELSRRGGAVRWQRQGASQLAPVDRWAPVVLAKPLTYMNRSGLAVGELLADMGLEPAAILVVADDVDLPLGRLRLRRDGGGGTHNGLRDVVAVVGAGFPRLRLGVRGEQPFADLADYVLAPFANDEQAAADAMVVRAADAVETALLEGLDPAMNRFNRSEP